MKLFAAIPTLVGVANAKAAPTTFFVVPFSSDPRHPHHRGSRDGRPRAVADHNKERPTKIHPWLRAVGVDSKTHAHALSRSPTASFPVAQEMSARANVTIAKNDDEIDNNREKTDWRLLVERAESTPPGKLTPDTTRDVLTVMRQLSSAGRRRDDRSSSPTQQRRQDATTVERLLNVLLRENQFAKSDRRDTHFAVNTRTYNLAIKAWANANVRGSAEKAERVLHKLRVAHVNAGETHGLATSLKPDLYSFAYCYAAWQRESFFAARTRKDAKVAAAARKRAESVLVSMKQVLMNNKDQSPPSQAAEDVNSLLLLWGTTCQSFPELLETFLRFIDVESRGTWLNTRSYNLVINGEVIPTFARERIIARICSPFDRSVGEKWTQGIRTPGGGIAKGNGERHDQGDT